jgi:hypothetical protein
MMKNKFYNLIILEMKVKELIGKLKELDGDREIYMWDYDYWRLREINIRIDAKVKYKLK